MKYIHKFIACSLVIFILYKGVAKYHFEYYYSYDHNQVVTNVIYGDSFIFQDECYLTQGIYKSNKIPGFYIKPTPTSEGDWVENVIFHSKGVSIYGSEAETKDLTGDFVYYHLITSDYRIIGKFKDLEKTYKNVSKIQIYHQN